MATPGVITEQAFPAGKGGFRPLSEAERKDLEKQQKDNASKK